MRNTQVPRDRMQDPLAWTLSPEASRDGERTPLQWEAGPSAGFTRGTPWLPVGADVDTRNVAAQRADPKSLLHLYRSVLRLRRRCPALHEGSYAALPAPPDVFAYERRAPGSVVQVALNLGSERRKLELPGGPSPSASARTGVCPRSPPRMGAWNWVETKEWCW